MNLKYVFLILAVVSLIIGFGSMMLWQGKTVDMVQGGFKGLGGVFFILFYILMLLGRQPADKTGSH